MHLFLIPTAMERDILLSDAAWAEWAAERGPVELCGFGPVASGLVASQRIAAHQPSRLWLLGIAGSYLDRADVGNALIFRETICYGVGVGSGSTFQSGEELGWKAWPDDAVGAPLGDHISLAHDPQWPAASIGQSLLTCCAASESSEEAAQRGARHPDAVAEDMEGYSVALAARVAGVPLTIVRGISNVAGSRDVRHWQTDQALRSVSALCRSLPIPI